MKTKLSRVLAIFLVALTLISVAPISKTVFNVDTGITAKAATTFYLYKTTASLNMREYADSDSKKLTTVPKGTMVFSHGDKSGKYTFIWYDIDGTTYYYGWVLTSYLQNTTIKKYKTTASLNLRAKANSSSKKIYTIPKGSTVYYYGRKSGDYTFVLYETSYDIIVGWVLTKYLSSTSSGSSGVTTSPKKVSGVKASSVTSSSVKLSWSKVSNITGYIIYKYIKSENKYVKVATVGSSTTSKTVSGLKSGTTYKFCVQAYSTKNGKNYYGSKSSLVTVKTSGSSSSGIYSAYKSKIKSCYNSYGYDYDIEYTVYDIDKDGTSELIVIMNGDSSDYAFMRFYTYKNGQATYIGDYEISHWWMGQTSGNGLYIGYAHMGYVFLDKVYISNGKLKTTEIFSGDWDSDPDGCEEICDNPKYGKEPKIYSYNDYSGLNKATAK